jgi:hypothetical protein
MALAQEDPCLTDVPAQGPAHASQPSRTACAPPTRRPCWSSGEF